MNIDWESIIAIGSFLALMLVFGAIAFLGDSAAVKTAGFGLALGFLAAILTILRAGWNVIPILLCLLTLWNTFRATQEKHEKERMLLAIISAVEFTVLGILYLRYIGG